MGGKGALIFAVGFAVIFGIININITNRVTKAVSNMIGYHESQKSRLLARIGANVGLAIYRDNPSVTGPIIKTFNKGNLACGKFIITFNDVSPHI